MLGDVKTDTRGDQLLTNLVSHNINWVNSGTTPTFTNSRGHCSIIDLTLVNTPGMDVVADWKVSDRISNSDHKYITFNITGVTTPSRPVRRNPNNTNWDEFQRGRDLDQKAEELLSAIRNAYHQCCPVTHVTGSNKKPPWLTKSVQNAHKDVRSKLMKARRLKTNQSWDEFGTHLKAYKKEIKDSKRTSWKTFCESASSVAENARIHKILKSTGKPARTIGPVYKNSESKTLTKSPAETLETLIKHHFKTDPINKSNGDTLIDLIYNQQRLSEVIKTMEPLKAPGPDGIQAILLKQSPDMVGRAMINLYKASHILGHIPKVLRETTGILIQKPGKKDYCDPKAYRTIINIH